MSAVAQKVQIFAFVFFVRIHIGIASSAVELKIFVIIVEIKKYKSIIKKGEKKHDKILLLAQDKLNILEGLTSKALTDLDISHGEFVLVNDVLKKYNDMKKAFKNPDNG